MKKGITLLELMVAIILTGIIGFIVFQMFLGENKNYTQTRAKIKLQTDAREAMRIMEEELKNAGYRLSNSFSTVNGRKSLATFYCNEGIYPENSKTAISAEPKDGSSIVFRLYTPKPGVVEELNCVNDRIEIAYSWDRDAKTLFRWYGKGGAGVDLKLPGVPFLENVTDFKVEFGRKTGYEELFKKNDLLTTTMVASSGVTQIINKTGQVVDSWSTSGWSSSKNDNVLIAKDIPLDKNSNYRIVINASASSRFLKETEGREYSRIVLCKDGNCIGDANRLVIPFAPTASSGDNIIYDFSVLTSGNYRISLEAAIAVSASLGDLVEIKINELQLLKLDNGEYGDWFQKNTSVTPEQWATVRAARISVTTEAKTNNESNTVRIIPLVNHGTKN